MPVVCQIPSMKYDWVAVWAINMFAGWVGYMCARAAAKAQVQRFR